MNVDNAPDVVTLEGASLDFLLTKLRDVTLRNQELEAALQLANRRVAFYENFDDSIRDAIAHALRTAFDIHERTEQQGRELLAEARQQAEQLRNEIAALAAERDLLATERNNLQRGIVGLRSRLQQEPPAAQPPASGETARLLVEVSTLESRLKAIRDSLDTSFNETPPATPQPPASPPFTSYEAQTPVAGLAEAPAADQPAAPWRSEPERRQPPVFDFKEPSPAIPTPEPATGDEAMSAQRIRPQAPALEDFQHLTFPSEDTAAGPETPTVQSPPSPRQPVYGSDAAELRASPASVSIGLPFVPEAPLVPPPKSAPVNPTLPVGTPDRPASATSLTSQPGDQVELVFSPVHSFPKLVELERSLRTLPEVKSFYVRDFRYGVATLLVRLNSADQRDDLPAKLEGLPGWNMVILSSPPNRIEAKIGA